MMVLRSLTGGHPKDCKKYAHSLLAQAFCLSILANCANKNSLDLCFLSRVAIQSILIVRITDH